ncbi:MAG: hypothetical protein LBK60_09075 [Verrucomicrobiales bacterium]|jgi:hypothetical protein|nr:hypothetical protein [Verrucomicrobiales bacterium]
MKTYLLEILTALTMTFTVSGQVLVDEQFTRSGTGPLNGSHPSGGTLAEGITWNPGQLDTRDWVISDAKAGTLTAVGAGSPGAIVWLPVTFSAGARYELTARLTNTAADWMGLGFGTFDTGWGMDGPWMIVRPNGNYSCISKVTADGATKTGATPTVNSSTANTLRLTLDTTGPNWALTYYINDLTTALANYTLTAYQQANLHTVFLAVYSNSAATVVCDWFKLEQIRVQKAQP